MNYSNRVRYPSSTFSPGIMGWYSFVPFMECKHGMIKESVDSSLEISLFDKKGQPLFSDTGTHAGLEIIEKILTYF